MTIPSAMSDLSVLASSNSPNGSVDAPSTLDDNIRAVAAIVRRTQARGAAIASGSTVNLGATADGEFVHITGTTTISSFGTVAAGIERTLVFDGALTLTHSSNLLCPYLTTFTTTAGDVMTWRSEGSGVWKCVSHLPASSSSERDRLGLGSAAVETIGTEDGHVGLLSTVSDRIDAAIAGFTEIPSVSGHEGEALIVNSGVVAWGRGFKKRTVTSASGSSVGFTSLPSNVDYFKIILNDVSPSATAVAHIRLGVSGSAISSGYESQRTYIEDPSTISITAETTSISSVACTNATTKLRVAVEIWSIGSDKWMASLSGFRGGDGRMAWSVGNITLSGTLDSLFVALSTGTFDDGQIALYY